jgi:hypothetical protein
MQLINNIDKTSPLVEIYRPTFQVNSSLKKSKTVEFFELLYKYPSNIKVKWDNSDELKGDSFLQDNFSIIEHSFPFSDFFDTLKFRSKRQNSLEEAYKVSDFRQSYQSKTLTSSFYSKKTKVIQKAVETVPVYTVLNGRGEIVLANSFNKVSTTTNSPLLNERLNDFCGDVGNQALKSYRLGLFFFDRETAELYVKEIAKSDLDGVKTLGLTIHCISLDSAYRIAREQHSNIDFRFIPNFDEVQNITETWASDKNIIVEDKQQQLRFRRRSVPVMTWLGKLGNCVTPFNSFLHASEYYKGVPIYIVQLRNTPRDTLTERYFNVADIVDNFYGGFLQYFDSLCGYGHNWIMQGSTLKLENSKDSISYVFFEKENALDFCKEHGRNVVRFEGSRTLNLAHIVKKPKIFAYNLEDFIEDWEDVLINEVYTTDLSQTVEVAKTGSPTILGLKHPLSPLFNAKKTVFVPMGKSLNDVRLYQSGSYKASPTKQIKQFFEVKTRTLLSFFNILLNYN